jgi:hypothetical protein
MSGQSKDAHDRAEAIFKKKEQQHARIVAENEAESDAIREKTARLKSLRLVAEKKADADKQPADKAIPVDKLNASNDG